MKNLRLFIFILGFLSFGLLCAQQKTGFKSLSTAEKCWVVTHLFKAKRAQKISLIVLKVTDSLKKEGDLGKHYNGNQLDAFKHAFWMWSLADRIGYRSAKSLGKAHEKGNKQFYKKHKKEDGFFPDQESGLMDTFNNQKGLALYKTYKKQKVSSLEKVNILKAKIAKGELKVLLQSKQGIFYDCDQKLIPKEKLQRRWITDKCLVPSNQKYF